MTVGINTHDRTAKGLGGQLGIQPLGAIFPGIGHLVAAFEAEIVQSQGKIPHVFIIAPPGGGLPDAEFLFTDGNPAVAVALGVAFEQGRKG